MWNRYSGRRTFYFGFYFNWKISSLVVPARSLVVPASSLVVPARMLRVKAKSKPQSEIDN